MEVETLQIQDVCEQIKGLADKASALAVALDTKNEQAREYSQKCHELSNRLANIRKVLVKEFGEEAKCVWSTTLIKRLIDERNECQAKLEKIMQDVENDKQIMANDERSANIKKVLEGILRQTPDKQLADLAKLHTIKGQGELIVKQREQIRALQEENLGLKGEITALQMQNSVVDLKKKEDDFESKNDVAWLNFENQELRKTAEYLSRQSIEITKECEATMEELEKLKMLNAELQAQLKKAEKYKISTIIKNFALKVKSVFRGKNSKQDDQNDDSEDDNERE